MWYFGGIILKLNDIIAFEVWKFPTICQINKLKILIEIF